MVKRKKGSPIAIDDFPEINALIAQFLDDVAKEFSRYSEMGINEPIIYGFNMRLNPAGQPIIGHFGNVKPTSPKVKFGEEREPLIDVIEKDKDVTLIAEMPGVNKETIKVTATHNEIDIEGRNHERAYNKHVKLSATIDPAAKAAQFNNGVLEIVFRKSARQKAGPSTITID